MIFISYFMMGTKPASEILCVSNYECDNGIRTVHLPCECHLYIFVPLRATDKQLNIFLQVTLS